jgi:hypothetical protein
MIFCNPLLSSKASLPNPLRMLGWRLLLMLLLPAPQADRFAFWCFLCRLPVVLALAIERNRRMVHCRSHTCTARVPGFTADEAVCCTKRRRN